MAKAKTKDQQIEELQKKLAASGVKERDAKRKLSLFLGHFNAKPARWNGWNNADIKADIDKLMENLAKQRPEIDIARQVVMVTLGGERVEIKERPCGEDAIWENKCGVIGRYVMNQMLAMSESDDDKDVDVAQMLGTVSDYVFGEGMKLALDIFWDYSKLNKKEINDNASQAEIVEAAMEVFANFACPFIMTVLTTLLKMTKLTGKLNLIS